MQNHTPTKKRTRMVIGVCVVVAAGAVAAWLTSSYWLPLVQEKLQSVEQSDSPSASVPAEPPKIESSIVKINSLARANLGLKSIPAVVQNYWRKIETTGVIIDRPGFTDQGVTTPVDCFVSKMHAYEGDIVRPGDKLFTLRLTSQYLQQTQSDYFKALRETEIINAEINRLTGLADKGIIPEKRMIELNQDLKRQQVEIQANRQDLIARGLGDQQLQQISEGNFIKTIDVFVPKTNGRVDISDKFQSSPKQDGASDQPFLELQELKVELGEKAQAGQILAVLANHNYLYINGHGFRKEATSISKAAEAGWPVDVEFIETESGDWPNLDAELKIRNLSNTVDLESRTFDFFIPLSNQSRRYDQDGRTFVIWRFRPGQRVRIQVPVEEIEDVFVVPSAAVVTEGPETFIFQQNGELFNRIAVHVLHRDRNNIVIANDGSIRNGFFIASNSAAALNRILKTQSASGDNMAGFHVHADGSVHANH